MINFIAVTVVFAFVFFSQSDPGKSSFRNFFSTERDFGHFPSVVKAETVRRLGAKKNCDALMLVLSTMDGNLTRAAIRSGWLKDIRGIRWGMKIQHKFVVGHMGNITDAAIISEIELHNDLLVLPFMDNYWNLSIKVGLMFKSPDVLNKCKFIVKVDSDVYVRAARFTAVIKALPTRYPIYGGYYYDQKIRVMPVPRNESNKFSFTIEEHPKELFNPYVGGPLYFLSNSVASRLPYTVIQSSSERGEVENIPSTYTVDRPSFFRLEDVFMGFLVGSMIPKVTFVHIPKFITDFDHHRQKHMVALHNVRDHGTMAQGHEMFG